MKKLAEQSLYEVLEVAPSASAGEIRGSYERLRKLLGPGSLAMYSLVEPAEAQALLLRLDEAWAVLSDAAERRRYDASIGLAPAMATSPARNSFRDAVAAIDRAGAGEATTVETAESATADDEAPAEFVLDEDDLLEVVEVPAAGIVVARATGGMVREGERFHGGGAIERSPPEAEASQPQRAEPAKVAPEVLDPDEIGAEPLDEPAPSRGPDVGPDTVFTGDLLRRVRLGRGLTLDEIARRTRIGTNHLANIEDERWSDLPERVFLRGYLAAYATELQLDPVQVYTSYLDRHTTTRRH